MAGVQLLAGAAAHRKKSCIGRNGTHDGMAGERCFGLTRNGGTQEEEVMGRQEPRPAAGGTYIARAASISCAPGCPY